MRHYLEDTSNVGVSPRRRKNKFRLWSESVVIGFLYLLVWFLIENIPASTPHEIAMLHELKIFMRIITGCVFTAYCLTKLIELYKRIKNGS